MSKLFIYKVSQSQITGDDTYDSAIVIAKNEKEAIDICIKKLGDDDGQSFPLDAEYISCKQIGKADATQKEGIVLASFNAG